MRILMSGASGFIGAPLRAHLLAQGHFVIRLIRSQPASADEIQWDPEGGRAVKQAFEGFDAVIHLAGEPLSLARWTVRKREKILYSRTVGTRLFAQILSTLYRPPHTFISASAFGFYGDRGEERLDEKSEAGHGFLANVCCEWEKACQPIEMRGTRVLKTRFGLVIGPHGGILQKMLLPYKLGLGACLGSGRQWMSWISLYDLIQAMDYLLQHPSLKGSINFVSPHPVRQQEFSQTLAHRLSRPAFLKIPAPLLRLFLGQVADELLLASTRVAPTKLLDAGFRFKYPTLEEAIQHALAS